MSKHTLEQFRGLQEKARVIAEEIRQMLLFASLSFLMPGSRPEVKVDFDKSVATITLPLTHTRSSTGHGTNPPSNKVKPPRADPPTVPPTLPRPEPPVLDPSKIFTPNSLIDSLTANYCSMYRCRCDFRVVEDVSPLPEVAVSDTKYPDLYEEPVSNLRSMKWRAKEQNLKVLGAADIPRFLEDPSAIPAWVRERKLSIVFAGTILYSRGYDRKYVMALSTEDMRVWLIDSDAVLDRRSDVLACK